MFGAIKSTSFCLSFAVRLTKFTFYKVAPSRYKYTRKELLLVNSSQDFFVKVNRNFTL